MSKQQVVVSLLVLVMSTGSWVAAKGVRNPTPGAPRDTIIIRVKKAESGPIECDGGWQTTALDEMEARDK